MKKEPVSLIISDPHLKESNIDLVKSIFGNAVDLCKKLKIHTILLLGDLFDSRKGQPLNVLKSAKSILRLCENNGIKIYTIPGNHDKQNYESYDSFLDIFQSENFIVFDRFTAISLKNLEIAFIPFFKEDSQILYDQFEKMKDWSIGTNTKKFVLCTHIGINGSITNENEHIQNCVPSSQFTGVHKVFVGHFHNRQEFENIVYVGSTHQSNFGEDEKKGFTILYEDGSYEFIQSNFPKFIKKQVSIENLTDFMLHTDFLHEAEGNNSRIELIGSSEQLKSFDKSILTDLGIEVVLKVSESILNIELTETITHDKNSLKDAYIEFNKELKREPIKYELEKLEEI